MSSPSQYRREGRNAFYRGGNPAMLNPYAPTSISSRSWIEGWEQAAREDRDQIALEAAQEAEEEAKLEEFARLYNLAKEKGLIS